MAAALPRPRRAPRSTSVGLVATLLAAPLVVSAERPDFVTELNEAREAVLDEPARGYFEGPFGTVFYGRFALWLNLCTRQTGQTLADLDLVVGLDPRGKVETVRARPESELTECFAGHVRNESFPAPPSGALRVPVSVRITPTGAAPEQAPGSSPSLPRAGLVKVLTIEPPEGTVLAPGAKVSFRARVWYRRIRGDGGVVGLLVYDQRRRTLRKTVTARTRQPEGDLAINADVLVPAEGVDTVRLFFFLATPEIASAGGGGVSVTYPVGE